MNAALLVLVALLVGISATRSSAGGAQYRHYKGEKYGLKFYYTIVRSEHVEGISAGHFFTVEYRGKKRKITFVLYPPLEPNFAVEDQDGNEIGKGACAAMDDGVKECKFDLGSMRLVITTGKDEIPTISGTLIEKGKSISWEKVKLVADGGEKYGI